MIDVDINFIKMKHKSMYVDCSKIGFWDLLWVISFRVVTFDALGHQLVHSDSGCAEASFLK